MVFKQTDFCTKLMSTEASSTGLPVVSESPSVITNLQYTQTRKNTHTSESPTIHFIFFPKNYFQGKLSNEWVTSCTAASEV